MQRGFTLTEVMLVIACIGVLATIAIPNYLKFSARARQGEAKMALASIYAVEKSFYVEHNSYTQCLRQAGYTPELNGKRYYSTGYMGADTNTCNGGADLCAAYGWNPTLPCDVTCTTFNGQDDDSSFIANKVANSDLVVIDSCANQSAAGLPSSWNVWDTRFTAGAAGSVSSRGTYDMWQIDENKVLSQIQNGL